MDNLEHKFRGLYLESFKKAVVAEVESEGNKLSLVCERHGIFPSVVGRWMKLYSQGYLENIPKRHTLSEKNKIVREILSGKITRAEAQKKCNLKSIDTIYWWIRAYKDSNPELLEASTEDQQHSEQVLMFTDVQKELEMTRLKNRALEVMLDVASTELKVDIRKKFGTKQ